MATRHTTKPPTGAAVNQRLRESSAELYAALTTFLTLTDILLHGGNIPSELVPTAERMSTDGHALFTRIDQWQAPTEPDPRDATREDLDDPIDEFGEE